MAPSPSDDDSVSASTKPSRPVARQACDYCRRRKRKCTFRDGAERSEWIDAGQLSSATVPCRSCEKSNIQCTFLLPLKTRGPKPRVDHQYLSFQSTSSQQSLEWESAVGQGAGQSPLSQQSPMSISQPSPLSTSLSIEQTAFSGDAPIGTPEAAFEGRRYATDILLPRDLVRFILRDYITYVYPVVPVIHIPTFHSMFDQEYDSKDPEFLLLIISLCAFTMGLLPSRFSVYREYKSPLPFESRTEMANHCYRLNQSLRSIAYWDTVNHQKWASSYLLALTFHQTGNTNLWRMLEVEAMQLLRLLEVQYVSSYTGLNPVETQLRKKAFWLMFYAYIHHVHSYRHERITFLDPMILQKIKLDELMPVAVDDEYITVNGVLPCPEDHSARSLTAGFNIHSRVFLSAQPQNPLCSCPGTKDPTPQITRLKDQVRQLKYMLDTVQPTYRPWNKLKSTHAPTSEDEPTVEIQREIIRANIQTTYLWLQIVLLDQVDTIVGELKASSGMPGGQTQTPESAWDERVNICRELLYTMHSFSYSALEPNGNALVSHHPCTDLILCPVICLARYWI